MGLGRDVVILAYLHDKAVEAMAVPGDDLGAREILIPSKERKERDTDRERERERESEGKRREDERMSKRWEIFTHETGNRCRDRQLPQQTVF